MDLLRHSLDDRKFARRGRQIAFIEPDWLFSGINISKLSEMKDSIRPLGPTLSAYVVLMAVLRSGFAVALKVGFAQAPPLRTGWMSTVVGIVTTVTWALTVKADLRVRRGEWFPLLLVGSLFAMQHGLINLGIQRTNASHGVVLLSSYPIWVASLAHFTVPGDSLTWLRTIGVLVAYSGVCIVFGQSLSAGMDVIAGDLLLALAMALMAVRYVYLARSAKIIDPAKLIIAHLFIQAPVLLAASLVFEGDPFRWSKELVFAALYVGIIGFGLLLISIAYLLRWYRPSSISLLGMGQPIFGIILSWLFLDEGPGILLIAGAALVAAGAWLAEYSGQKRKTGQESS